MADYLMYLRKSRADLEAEARGEGETLARHRATLTDLARRMELNVVEVYEEIVSGDSLASRPAAQRLLARVGQGGVAGVLCMAPDRLARGDTVDQGLVARAFASTRTLIITPYKTYDPSDEMDEEFFEFNLFMARREYKAIKRRMQAGRVASVKEGNYLGTRMPYGYRRAFIDRRPSLEPDPEQAPIVRLMFDWYLHGMDGRQVGREAIAARLNSMGLTTAMGKRWTSASIRIILRNPIYVGLVRWNQRNRALTPAGRTVRTRQGREFTCKGRHAAIIDQETFDGVQELLRGHTAPPVPHDGTVENPFAGVLKCGICGRAMVRHIAHGKCSLRCHDRSCATTSIDMAIVDEAVLAGLNAWIAIARRDDAPALAPGVVSPERAAVCEQLQRSLDTVSAQRGRLYDLLEQGIYTVDVFTARMAELSRREDGLRAELASASSTPTEAECVRALLPQLLQVVDLYPVSDPTTKNALLKTVVRRIDYHKTRHCYRNQNPAEYLSLDLHPITPKSLRVTL